MRLDIYSQQILTEEGYSINGGELKAPHRPFTQGDYEFLLNGGDIHELTDLSPMGKKMAWNAFNQWGQWEKRASFKKFIKNFFFARKLTRVLSFL